MDTKTRAPRGGGSVFRTMNNGIEMWCASITYWSEDGKRRFIRGFGSTRSEAVSRRTKNLSKRFAAPEPAPTQVHQRGPRVSEFLETWLTNPSVRLGEETKRKYRRDVEIHIIPALEDAKLTTLTPERLHKLFYQDLGTVGHSAKYHAFTNFSTMLNYAVKKGVLVKNPLLEVVKPNKKTEVAHEDGKMLDKRVRLSIGLLNWIQQPTNPHHEHYPLVLWMFLGLRRSELLGLSWKNFLREDVPGEATVKIEQQLARYEKNDPSGNTGWYIKNETKTKKSRVIHIPERWQVALMEQKLKKIQSSEDWSSDLVFLDPRTRKAWNYNNFYAMWKKVIADYISSGPDQGDWMPTAAEAYFRPHYSRHVCASILFDQGVPLEVAQSILGHSQSTMTLYYTHFTKTMRRNATAALGTGLKTTPRRRGKAKRAEGTGAGYWANAIQEGWHDAEQETKKTVRQPPRTNPFKSSM